MLVEFSKNCIAYIYRLKLFLLLFFILSSCENIFDGYVRNGIGTDLYSSDLDSATKNQDIYFGFICHQAGIAESSGDDGYPRCAQPLRPNDLTLFVQAGFNDIDRRCDAYLAWLEDARHRDAFYNSQLNQVARLTNAILTATSPEAGVTIGIVAEAFGYAKSVFSDYQTRIMLGYESSTIKTIVSQRRLDFRNEFASQSYNTKPSAVFVLRSYLRICMPYTITMDANTYARAIVSGSVPANYNNAAQVRTAISHAAPLSAAAPITKQTRIRKSPTGSSNKYIDPAILRSAQKYLCVPADGVLGPKTKEAIRIYQRLEKNDVTGDLTPKQAGKLSDKGKSSPCSSSYKNFLEREFGDNLSSESDFVGALRSKMQKKSEEMELGLTVPEVTTLNGLRASISEFKDKLNISKSGSETYLNQQVTGDFIQAIGLGSF